MIDISNVEILDRFSTTGTPNLQGAIGQRMQAVIDLYVHWEAIEADITFYNDQIILNSGSWFDYGFKNGDTIEVIVSPTSSGTGSNVGSYEIVSLTTDIMQCAVSGSGSGSGTLSFTTEVGVSYYAIHGTTPVNSMEFLYGLVENSDAPAYTSLIDGTTQRYSVTGIDASGMGTNTLVPQGTYKSWLSTFTSENSLTNVSEMGIGTSGVSYGYEQCFRITHTFRIEPVLTAGMEDVNGDLSQALTVFNSSDCLKYVFKVNAGFRPGSADHTTDDGNINSYLTTGNTGWFDEFRNGGSPEYSLSYCVYADTDGNTIDSVATNDDTTVVIQMLSASGKFTSATNFEIYAYELPNSTTDYENTSTSLVTNFDVSTVFINEGSPATDNNHISEAEVLITDPTIARIEFKYTTGVGADKKYLFFVVTGDEAVSDLATNDTMAVLVDYNQVQTQIYIGDDVIGASPVINEHSTNDENLAYTDWKGWIEDGMRLYWDLSVKKNVGPSNAWTLSLRNVTIEVIAENASDSTLNFTLETDTLTAGTNTTRGFTLYSGDPKNKKYMSTATVGASYNRYTLEWATKGRYESWLPQTNADPTDFPSATKNWSDYILSPDWSIKLKVTLNCTATRGDESETVTIYGTIPVELLDYEEYFNCTITGEINTYYAPTMDNLGGSLAKTANTIVVARAYGKELFPCIYEDNGSCEFTQIQSGSGSFSNADTGIDGCPEYYGILEIDKGAYGGNEFNIEQASTLWPLASGVAWVGQPTIVMYPYAAVPYIEMIGEIDYTKLDTSVPSYKLSARFGKEAETICSVSIMGTNPEGATTIVNSAIIGYTVDDILLFLKRYERSVDGITSIVGDTITIKGSAQGTYKICCSVDPVTGTSGNTGSAKQIFPSLIGLTLDDFLLFAGNSPFNNIELTTKTGTTLDTVTGEINQTVGNWVSNPYKISFHTALISTTVSAVTTYTNALLAGKTIQDVMIFVEGWEYTTLGATISGTTITFPSAVTGKLKVCNVNQ